MKKARPIESKVETSPKGNVVYMRPDVAMAQAKADVSVPWYRIFARWLVRQFRG